MLVGGWSCAWCPLGGWEGPPLGCWGGLRLEGLGNLGGDELEGLLGLLDHSVPARGMGTSAKVRSLKSGSPWPACATPGPACAPGGLVSSSWSSSGSMCSSRSQAMGTGWIGLLSCLTLGPVLVMAAAAVLSIPAMRLVDGWQILRMARMHAAS